MTKRAALGCFFVLFLLLLNAPVAQAISKNVLVLHSYHPTLKWNQSMQRAIEDVFEASHLEASIVVEFMDTKRFNDEVHYANLLQTYRHKFRKQIFDIVIVSDNNAFEFILKHGQELFPGVPVVFCGVNDLRLDRLAGYPDITGTAEALDFEGGIKLVMQLHPDVKRIFSLGQSSPTWDRNSKLFEAAGKKVGGDVEVRAIGGLDLDMARTFVEGLGPGDVAFVGDVFQDKWGVVADLEKATQIISAASNVPVYGLWEFQVGNGVVGGLLTSGRAQGETAAAMALEILTGQPVSKIPVITRSPNRYVFDYKVMSQHDISMAALPEGSRVLNKPVSFYEQNKPFVVSISGFILVLVAVIIILISVLYQRRRIQQQLRATQKYYHAIFNSTNDAIILHDTVSGEILDVNDSMLAMFGCTREEAIGKSIGAFSDEEAGYNTEKAQQVIAKTVLEGPQVREWRGIRGDGSGFWSEAALKFFVTQDGPRVLAVVRDVDERKKTEKRLEQQHAFMESLFAAIPNPVFYKDVEGRYLGCNDIYARQVLGTTREEIIGKTLEDLTDVISPEQVEFHLRQDAELLRNPGMISYEMDREHRGIQGRFYNYSKATFGGDGGDVHGIVGVMLDVTEMRKANETQQRLIAELEDKNAELERFTYTVSHDLKSPIITIKGFAGMLQHDLANENHESVAKDLERIDSAAVKMSTLLDELLELSRVGRMENPATLVDLGELAGDVAGLLQGRIEQCGGEIRIMEGLPVVLADRARMQEVLQNLIDNAAKFAAHQPCPQLEVGMRADGAERVLYVSDNGMGIDPKYCDRVFNLFEKLEPGGEGTGVGLALVKRIVEHHDGRVWVESEGQGRGTRICFTLGPRCWPEGQ